MVMYGNSCMQELPYITSLQIITFSSTFCSSHQHNKSTLKCMYLCRLYSFNSFNRCYGPGLRQLDFNFQPVCKLSIILCIITIARCIICSCIICRQKFKINMDFTCQSRRPQIICPKLFSNFV